MPFINLNSADPIASATIFDITIIGAGAAGILMALKLASGGKNVCMLESGCMEYDSSKQDLNNLQQTGKFLSNAIEGRRRIVGGTTTAWGGQSLPFSEFDFSRRPWLDLPEWPFSYEEVSQYYAEANAFLKVDGLNYTSDIFENIKLNPPAFDGNKITYHVAKWAPEPDFKKLYYTELEKKVTVYYNAHLTKIEHEFGRISSVAITNFSQKKYELSVKKLVITAGSIETVRILLTNNINDISGVLGKGFMDHPCIKIAKAEVARMYSFQRYFNTHQWRGKKYSIRLSIAPDYQRKAKILNCSASFMFFQKENNFDLYAEMKEFWRDKRIKRLPKILLQYPKIIMSLFALVKHRFFYKGGSEATLVLMTEQECMNSSSITLSEMKDKFGVPKASLHWDLSKKSWETVVKSAEVLKCEVERLGLAKINLLNNINPGIVEWKENLFDVNHHMGGARLGASPQKSVVNENLQLWSIKNAFICSSAVFPTSSHSNPTLTILALGCRLTKYLLNTNEADEIKSPH